MFLAFGFLVDRLFILMIWSIEKTCDGREKKEATC